MDSGTVVNGPMRYVKDWDVFPDDFNDSEAREIGEKHGSQIEEPPKITQVCRDCGSDEVVWEGTQWANTLEFNAYDKGGWCNICEGETYIVDITTLTLCKYCGTALHQDPQNTWLDCTDGDCCWGEVNEGDPHVPYEPTQAQP